MRDHREPDDDTPYDGFDDPRDLYLEARDNALRAQRRWQRLAVVAVVAAVLNLGAIAYTVIGWIA